ncbi:hypothetical protein OBBRIDRAFT_793209 [Obba rivulosa]|uniref:Uncharacterized protein n=1 Tax=Obba rivulosa TaxID=1052685 RepID=A0A8E2AUF0_9APHY|nr:hypothetical protein OBBRIDRAFT_793209 [Obba rivulosa]
MSWREFPWDALRVLRAVCFAIASYLFHRQIAGHHLTVARLSILTLSARDIHYTATLYDGTYSFDFKASSASVRFHLPRPTYPCWLTFIAGDLLYTSLTADVSVSKLDATFWVFPVLFRFTAGPWLNLVLDDFRIRIFSSRATPFYIQRLRQNLVRAILVGEYLRVDDVWTTVQFAGLSDFVPGAARASTDSYGFGSGGAHDAHGDADGAPNGSGTREGEEREGRLEKAEDPAEKTQKLLPRDREEFRASAFVRQLHINNTEGRIYTFGKLDAQLRRDWDSDTGTFVLVAEDSRWVRVHWPYQRAKTTAWWIQLAAGFLTFPYDLINTFQHPVGAVNLYIPRADITFDEYRIRDAELILQSISLIREKSYMYNINTPDVLFNALGQMMTPR